MTVYLSLSDGKMAWVTCDLVIVVDARVSQQTIKANRAGLQEAMLDKAIFHYWHTQSLNKYSVLRKCAHCSYIAVFSFGWLCDDLFIPISFKVPSLALGQSHHCYDASEAMLKNVNIPGFDYTPAMTDVIPCFSPSNRKIQKPFRRQEL